MEKENMYGLIDTLSKQDMFIFEIKGKCFYLGAQEVRACTEEETGLYKAYADAFNQIKSSLSDATVKNLVSLCIRISNEERKEEFLHKRMQVLAELEALMKGLTDEEIQKIYEQNDKRAYALECVFLYQHHQMPIKAYESKI